MVRGVLDPPSTPEEEYVMSQRQSQDRPGKTGAMPEVWRLAHPEFGMLELAVGRSGELRELDQNYPHSEIQTQGPTTKESGEKSTSGVGGLGYVLLRGGELVARAKQLGDHKVSLHAVPPEAGAFSAAIPAVRGPRVQIRCNAVNTAVRQVSLRNGRQVVHFDPPPGSAAQERLEAIAASPWKRVAYPIAGGLGKSGWALAAIFLFPVLGRLLERVLRWIRDLLPEVSIPWPDISLPSIPWPDITVPWPDLPEFTLPGWVQFLLECSKVWVPVVIALAVAVVAVRHARRSERIKAQWQATPPEADSDRRGDHHEDKAGPDG